MLYYPKTVENATQKVLVTDEKHNSKKSLVTLHCNYCNLIYTYQHFVQNLENAAFA